MAGHAERHGIASGRSRAYSAFATGGTELGLRADGSSCYPWLPRQVHAGRGTVLPRVHEA